MSALDKSRVKEKWHTPYDLYLTAREAYEMKTADPDDVLMIDLRARADIQLVGYTDMADANIPLYFRSDEWKPKKDGIHGTYRKTCHLAFVDAADSFVVSKNKVKSIPIILTCTSRSRSPAAASDLYDTDCETVYFQVQSLEGVKSEQGPNNGKRVVNGWKISGLPWVCHLKTETMYFNFVPAGQP